MWKRHQNDLFSSSIITLPVFYKRHVLTRDSNHKSDISCTLTEFKFVSTFKLETTFAGNMHYIRTDHNETQLHRWRVEGCIFQYGTWIQGFKDSKTFIWQRNTCIHDNNPSIFHFMRSKPISYNIHWGKHCGHWTLIGLLHMEGQSTLHFINASRKDKFATSGDPY